MGDSAGRQPTWAEINRVLLPELERSTGTVRLPPGDHVAVVGPHRSGTTWLANLLGDGLAADRPYEKDCARILLGTSTATDETRRVLQGTFLMPCPRVAASLAAQCFTVAIVRDPVDVVRSMVHNWSGLEDVSALVEAVHGLSLPVDRVDRASTILGVSMRELLELLSHGLIDVAVTYACLVGASDTVFGAVADGRSAVAPSATRRASARAPHPRAANPLQVTLSGAEEQRIRRSLQCLHLEAIARMGPLRATIDPGG